MVISLAEKSQLFLHSGLCPALLCTLCCSEQVLSKSFVIDTQPTDYLHCIEQGVMGTEKGILEKEKILFWRKVCQSQYCLGWTPEKLEKSKESVKNRRYLFCFLRHYCTYLPGQELWLIVIDQSSYHEVFIKYVICMQHSIPEKWGVPRKIVIKMNILVLVFPLCTQTSRLQSGIITSQFFERAKYKIEIM